MYKHVIKVPCKHRETIRNLSNNQNVVIMKQDKGRGIVIMDRNKYFDKCLALLNSEQFVKLNQDPTTMIERKFSKFYEKSNKNCQKKYIKSYIQQGHPLESFMKLLRFINYHQVKVLMSFL